MATFNVTRIVEAVITELEGRSGFDNLITEIKFAPNDPTWSELLDSLNTKIREAVGGCLANCQDEEPIFVLCGRDETAADNVFQWARNADDKGVNRQKVDDALNVHDEMRAWEPKKLPD